MPRFLEDLSKCPLLLRWGWGLGTSGRELSGHRTGRVVDGHVGPRQPEVGQAWRRGAHSPASTPPSLSSPHSLIRGHIYWVAFN